MFIIVDYIITKVTTDDEPFLWEMLYQSLYVPDGNEPFSRDILKEQSIAKYLEGWGRSGDLGFVARLNDGTPIGSVTARLFSEKNKSYGFVDIGTPELGMAILPEHRGKGIGTMLIKKILKELKNQGINSVSLSVDPNNPAIRLYKRLGFEEVDKVGTSITMKLTF